jgi:acetolactate synthase-1/2/3 large subunit
VAARDANFFERGSQMNDNGSLRSGGQILVDCLKTHGVNRAFCVPGESFLAVLDALYDAREQIRLFVCRQ